AASTRCSPSSLTDSRGSPTATRNRPATARSSPRRQRYSWQRSGRCVFIKPPPVCKASECGSQCEEGQWHSLTHSCHELRAAREPQRPGVRFLVCDFNKLVPGAIGISFKYEADARRVVLGLEIEVE